MIYYYSATGNTRYSARELGKLLQTETVNILSEGGSEKLLQCAGEEVGVLFPIYCWGIPPVMARFLALLLQKIDKDSYLWAVCTCGDEAGTAMRHFNRIVSKYRGRGAEAIYSLQMPNTYVLLPGFDVDSPDVERTKLEAAPGRLHIIAEAVKARRKGVYEVTEGSLPSLRSAIFPLFEKWGVFPKYWKASDKCISCAKCARICPARNISMEAKDGGLMRPVWGGNCYSCCACFHVCPVKAVSYGSVTKSKSQYICPL